MPSPLKNWELENIDYFLVQYLQTTLNDNKLSIVFKLQEAETFIHIVIIKSDTKNKVESKYKIHLDLEGSITIKVTLLVGQPNHYQITIKPEKILKLRSHINNNI